MKVKIKFTKKQLKEIKETQDTVAKKTKSPDFWKTVPEAEVKVNRTKI